MRRWHQTVASSSVNDAEGRATVLLFNRYCTVRTLPYPEGQSQGKEAWYYSTYVLHCFRYTVQWLQQLRIGVWSTATGAMQATQKGVVKKKK